MKYRTKEELIYFYFAVYKNLTTEPVPEKNIAKNMGLEKSKITQATALLMRAGLIGALKAKGLFKTSEISEEEAKKIISTAMPKRGNPRVDLSKVKRNKLGQIAKKNKYLGKLGPKIDVNPLTKRKCRECGKFLPASRYFKCDDCSPVLSLLDDEFVYMSEGWCSQDDEIFIGYALDNEHFSSDLYGGKEKEEDSED